MNMRLTHPMANDVRSEVDTTVGALFALAAIAFGVVGWIVNVVGVSHSEIWFLSGAILGILAIAVVLDESRLIAHGGAERTEMALSWLLMLGALGLGVVGFVVGFIGDHQHLTWLWSGLIVAIVSVGMVADEGRRLRTSVHGLADELMGTISALLALAVGVVGFVLGIMGNGDPYWLYAGVIAALAAVAFMLDGERRAAVAAMSQPAVETTRVETRENYRPPMTG